MKLPLKVDYDDETGDVPSIVDADGEIIAFGPGSLENHRDDLEELVRSANYFYDPPRRLEVEKIPEEDLTKFPRCPVCWTTGHFHRKDCRYRDDGMTNHVRTK